MNAEVNILAAFVQHVVAQRGKHITVAAADYLTVGANFLIGQLKSGLLTIDASQNAPLDNGAAAAADATPAGGAAAWINRAYFDVLGRQPTPDELNYWVAQVDQGESPAAVALAIVRSDEYYANFVIKPDYLKLLGRTADQAGVDYWTQKMQSGLTDQELEAGFVASDEFFNDAGGKNISWIDSIYKLLLDRPADSAGEDYWNGQLNAGVSRGDDVALRIADGAESNTQLINDDYYRYLGRAADPDGLAFWLEQFADGKTNEDVIAGFTGSDEYYRKYAG